MSQGAGFLPAHTIVAAEGEQPSAHMFVLHGIYGSAGNWRSFARKLVQARPDWALVLVDLRLHGESQAAPPPHDLDSTTGDLLRLGDELHSRGLTVRAVMGHSFGGKVALMLRKALADAGRPLAQTWVIDASASPRPEAATESTVTRVLELLFRLPPSYPSREAFVRDLEAEGIAPPVATWLSQNLVRRGAAFQQRLDPAGLKALLDDHFARDLWPSLQDPAAGELRFVLAGHDSSIDSEDRERLRQLSDHPSGARLVLHDLPQSGHWVHIDAPEALLTLLQQHLPPGR